ncbi:hypothetical protein M0657_011525 [Pyricularia oryzae]|nr:hypothetical protein M0657_011525 [Pyricularia oryzae]KAI7911676.1 hypothetical protein M9X92_010427 [Pyricularia oryzae]
MTSCGRGQALTTSGTWYAPAIPDGASISRLVPRKALSPVLWPDSPHTRQRFRLTGYLPFC